MAATVTGIFRHPVKGFTPERLTALDLAPGCGVPFDRLYAVENGPCGFDPAAPAFTPKQKFAVLAAIPRVAAARTRYAEDTGVLTAEAPGLHSFTGDLAEAAGREAFAAWLALLLGDEARGPLRVLQAPQSFRFTDHPAGQVSVLNLASVRDLEARVGRPVDPRRFRANLHVEGWPPWAENDWAGRALRLGGVEAMVFKPIVRCAAIDVNPTTARRDLELPRALFDNYGHMFCGVYVQVAAAGRVVQGDDAAVASGSPP